MENSIPVLDVKEMGGYHHINFVNSFGQALENCGFVSLINHGFDLNLIRNLYESAATVFMLADQLKSQYIRKEQFYEVGYAPFRAETAVGAIYPDLKEFWSFRRQGNHLNNVYPRGFNNFKKLVKEFFDLMDVISLELAQAIGIYLNIFDLSHKIKNGDSLLRLINYQTIPSFSKVPGLRSAEHTDISLFTIIASGTVGGLQVQHPLSLEWLKVEPIGGSLIVNAGKMMETMTEGRIPAAKHRVINEPRSQRLSAPFFVHPKKDTQVGMLDGKSVTTQEFLEIMLAQTF